MMTRFAAMMATTLVVAGSAVQAGDPASCAAVRMSDLGWTDIGLTNATAEVILQALGYQPTQNLLALDVTYVAMQRGDIDIFQGNWRPIQDVQYKAFFDDGSVSSLVENLTGAKYTLAVPDYVAEAGVKSYDDLAAHAAEFGSTIYAIEPGSNQALLDMVAADRHGLSGWTVAESSEAGMLSQVARDVPKKEWIVFLAWEPHPMNLNYKLTYLAGGDADYGPDFGGSTVHTVARKGYAEACPNAAKLFSNLVYDIAYENIGMQKIMGDGMEFQAAAKAMMLARPDLVAAWLKDVTTLDGLPGLGAVQAALGQ
jgi:glycine betaine/proline transport system substrate-binding protein